MKRKIIIIFVIAALLSILSTGTLAYHVVYGTAQNVITTGNVDVMIHNRNADGSAVTGGVHCLPGSVIGRVVTVENIGDQPIYVRIALRKYVENSDLPAEDCLNITVDTVNWIQDGGYYYYKEALSPGHITPPLFTEVEIDGKNVDNEYLGKTLMLDVSAYAVQSKNNAGYVLDAIGWPMP